MCIMRLPEFLVIGAMKAGTSSLHRYLDQHPEIFVTRRKEINFFNSGYKSGLNAYSVHFAEAGDRIAGESSVNYLKAHKWPGTAERVYATLPNVRLICVLRDPVDRILSHYLHNVHNGREKRRISDAIAEDGNLVLSSRYAYQLDQYLANYDRDHVGVIATDDLQCKPQRTLETIFRFLGVAESVQVDTSRRLNVTAQKFKSRKVLVPEDPSLIETDTGFVLTAGMRDYIGAILAPDVKRLTTIWPDLPTWGLV